MPLKFSSAGTEGHMRAGHLGKKRKKQGIETNSKPMILTILYVLLSELAFMLSIRNNIQNNNILTRDLKKNIGSFMNKKNNKF